jgi:methenyltetrahydrofolate cyclohydrolase
MPEIVTFLEDLASASPVPGGGSVSGLETAMGAALIEMVSNLTLGRKRYEDVREEVTAIQERAGALRVEASALADADAKAYGVVSDVMSLPKDTDEQREERRRRLQDALKEAIEPPLRIMEAASEVMQLASMIVHVGNKSAISDVGVAALSARAGYHAAKLNVEINLAAIKDERWVADAREAMARIPMPDDVERAVMQTSLAVIHGAPA